MTATPPRAATFGLFQQFEPLDSGWRPFPHHYLLYAASGTFYLEVATAQWLLPPQRAALIAAGTPIRIQARAPVTCCSVIMAPEAFAAPSADCRVFTVSPLAREMIRHAMRWGPDRPTPDPVAERFFAALADLCAALAAAADRFWLPRGQSPELQAAMAYTLDRLAGPLSFPEVARACALSERTLARRFAQEAQLTWRQFLQRARLIRATELLAGRPDSVLEVAYACGFESASAFTSAFRAFTGETPAQFRRGLHPA